MELVVFACAIELQNALCPLSYEPSADASLDAFFRSPNSSVNRDEALRRWDVNNIPHETRIGNACARAHAQLALKAAFDNVIVLDEGGNEKDPFRFVFYPTLARFIACITDYMAKSRAVDKIIDDAETETGRQEHLEDDANTEQEGASLFTRNLEWVYARWPNLKGVVTRRYGKSRNKATNLIFPMVEFSVRRRTKEPGSCGEWSFLGPTQR